MANPADSDMDWDEELLDAVEEAGVAGTSSAQDGGGQTQPPPQPLDCEGAPRKGGRGGGRPSVRKGWRICSGCNKQLPPEQFGSGSKYCLKDKPAVQNLTNVANAQGETEWWQSVLQAPLQLRKALARYHDRCPKVPGKARPSFQFVQCQP